MAWRFMGAADTLPALVCGKAGPIAGGPTVHLAWPVLYATGSRRSHAQADAHQPGGCWLPIPPQYVPSYLLSFSSVSLVACVHCVEAHCCPLLESSSAGVRQRCTVIRSIKLTH